MVLYFWYLFQAIIGYNLIFPMMLYVLHLFKTKKIIRVDPLEENNFDYGIIVTAYEQTDLLTSVVDSILRLEYSNYLIYVVADNCDISNLSFDNDRVILLRPESVLANNVRSHLYAIDHFKREHNLLTIIDSDNIVDPNYLKELNFFFNDGYQAVQGVREAKNLNSVYACLDAARDIYYHFYDGQLLFDLGSSATLSGSGMAFTTALYKECFSTVNFSGAGFDKVLQAQILRKGLRIAFAKKAIVYDEKTAQTDQLVNQRSRWINTWFKYFKYGFEILWNGIKNFNLNQFLFGVVLVRPPLFMFILVSLLCAGINLVINPLITLIWIIALGIFILSFYISLRKSSTDARIYRSLINIPKFIYFQLVSLVHSRQANKRSVATKHHINS